MTSLSQKELIIAYRDAGLSYKEIAEKTGTSDQFCRTVCSRASHKREQPSYCEGICRYCGKELTHTPGSKKKQFCDDKCRTAFYNREKQHRAYVRTCEYCGNEFVSYGYPKKRYCSRDCRTLAERRERENDHKQSL